MSFRGAWGVTMSFSWGKEVWYGVDMGVMRGDLMVSFCLFSGFFLLFSWVHTYVCVYDKCLQGRQGRVGIWRFGFLVIAHFHPLTTGAKKPRNPFSRLGYTAVVR